MEKVSSDGIVDIMHVYAVTGGTGFIGEHLVCMLAQRVSRAIEIRVIDVKIPRKIRSEYVNIVYTLCDIRDTDKLTEIIRGADVVFHCAAIVDAFGSFDKEDVYDVNVRGTHSIITACVSAGVSRIVYTSSMEAIGPNSLYEEFVGDEDTYYNTINNRAYARSKAEAEALMLTANGRRVSNGDRLGVCIIRPTGVFGEGCPIMRRIYRGYKTMNGFALRTVSRTATQSRVYVGNVAWMHVLAAKDLLSREPRSAGRVYYCYDDSPEKTYEEFNVDMMEPLGIRFSNITIPRCVLRCLAVINTAVQSLLKPIIRLAPMLTTHTLDMANSKFVVVTRRARRELGYAPLYDYSTSAQNTVEWLRTL